MLIVDDSPDIRELWRLWLTFWGFSVEEAGNGHDAMRKATEFPPDLILMDLWMPVVGGIEAMQRLKADRRTKDVPVLVVSAETDAPDSSTALAAGADAVLAKPCDPDRLLDHVRLAMGRARFPS